MIENINDLKIGDLVINKSFIGTIADRGLGIIVEVIQNPENYEESFCHIVWSSSSTIHRHKLPFVQNVLTKVS